MRMNTMDDYRDDSRYDSLCAFCEKRVAATLTNETLSLYEGLEEVENVLVDDCDECGNMSTIPAESLPRIQQAARRLLESIAISNLDEVSVDLQSIVDRKKERNQVSERDHQDDYPIQATG